MNDCKRAALAGALCGTGKCSLYASVTVLSAAGIECCAAPTGEREIPGNDGGEIPRPNGSGGDLRAYAQRWKEAGLSFSAVAAAFPQTDEQADALSGFLETLNQKNRLTMLGPSGFSGSHLPLGPNSEEAGRMERLCAAADLVVLHISDAASLLGEGERREPWDRRSVEKLLRGLCALGPKAAVVVGVWFNPDLQGAAACGLGAENVSYAFSHRISGKWYGAGDLFSSALLAGLLNGMEISLSLQLAVDFTADCIRRTREAGVDGRFGLKFEACLPKLIRQLGLSDR